MNAKKITNPSLSSHQARGRFITLEGSEGAGKSTQLEAVKAWLEAHQIPHQITREPGGPPLSEAIRELVLDPQYQVQADTELLLMFAARAQHIHESIMPQLQSGVWVVSDRFTDSTYAYQGMARGFDLERIEYLEQWVQQDLQPDLTLLYDVPVNIGLKRASMRSASDRIEQESKAFFDRVRQGYLMRAKQHPDRVRIIDASPSVELVTEQTTHTLDQYLESIQHVER